MVPCSACAGVGGFEAHWPHCVPSPLPMVDCVSCHGLGVVSAPDPASSGCDALCPCCARPVGLPDAVSAHGRFWHVTCLVAT